MSELFVPYKKHPGGRPRKFKRPKELEEAFVEYLGDREGRPLVYTETEKGDVGDNYISKKKEKIKSHPLSIADFCVYLGMCRNWWNELPDEFLGVKSRISDYIFCYQLKGAEVGEFNANIVARELGLADKKEVTAGEGFKIVVNSEEEKKKLESMKDLQI